jgi:biopolymer transport protein TolQ
MTQDLSILHLVLNASVVVQAVMLLLMVVSISSWAAIFKKLFALNRIKSLNEVFERNFWSGTSLNDLFTAASKNAAECGPKSSANAASLTQAR